MKQYKDFIFVRHGETNWGRDDILKGPLDLSLNELGYKQAENAASILKEHVMYPIIFSSNLKRALKTASIIEPNQNICIKEKLKERYYGDFSINNSPTDAEKTEDFQQRIIDVLTEIFAETNTEEIIIVSHQKVFEFLVQLLTGQTLRLDHCEICKFKYIGEGKYIVSKMNKK